MTCPDFCATICGSKPMRHAQRAEIIQLHGAFEVVEAIVAGFDGAANRTAGVVHQDVDVSMLGEQDFQETFAIGHVGEVGRVGRDVEAFGIDLLLARRPAWLRRARK